MSLVVPSPGFSSFVSDAWLPTYDLIFGSWVGEGGCTLIVKDRDRPRTTHGMACFDGSALALTLGPLIAARAPRIKSINR